MLFLSSFRAGNISDCAGLLGGLLGRQCCAHLVSNSIFFHRQLLQNEPQKEFGQENPACLQNSRQISVIRKLQVNFQIPKFNTGRYIHNEI